MKLMYKYLLLVSLVFVAYSCEENEFENINPEEAISFDLGSDAMVLENDSDTYQIKLQSTTTASTDRVYTIEVLEETADGSVATTADASSYSYNNQITIPAGEYIGQTELSFDISSLNFSEPNYLVFGLVDGDFVKNVTRDELVFEFQRACPLNLISLNIFTDDYPDETTWELYDLNVSTTVEIASGGPFDGMTNTTLNIPMCLGAGNYGIIVRDSYGDGLATAGFTVTLDGVTLTSGTVGPSASPGSIPSFGSATFDLE